LLSELNQVTRDQESYDRAIFESFSGFVRAVALDRAGRAGEAWDHFLTVNRALFVPMRKELWEMAERQRASLARLRERPLRLAADSGRDGLPISLFILGPSRSGKTTMEHLVSTLDGVKRGYENPSVDTAVRRAFPTAALLAGRFESLPADL